MSLKKISFLIIALLFLAFCLNYFADKILLYDSLSPDKILQIKFLVFFSMFFPAILIFYFFVNFSKKNHTHPEKNQNDFSISDNLPEYVLIHDIDGKIYYMNKNLKQFINEDCNNFFECFKKPEQISDVFKSKEIRRNTQIGVFKLKAGKNKFMKVKIFSSPLQDNKLLSLLINFTEIRDIEEKMFVSQKCEIMGTLSLGLTHDFKNILQNIKLLNEVNKNTDSIKTVQKNADSIDVIVDGAFDYILNFLKISKDSDDDYVIADTVDLLEENIDLIKKTLPKNISINFDNNANDSKIRMVKSRFCQAMLNLCLNAQEAIGDKKDGKINIVLEKEHLNLQNFIKISISDNGKGMDENQLKNIFKTFYTTKGDKGIGIGLSMVRFAIKEFGGFITVNSSPGNGSIFHIFLPEYINGKTNE